MAWNDAQIDAVWNKATAVNDYDPDLYRKDVCGAWMSKKEYGMQTTLGWEIDHVFPESKAKQRGYTQAQIDDFRNLRPMQWENNRSKGDSYPSYDAAITSQGKTNVAKVVTKTVNETYTTILNALFRYKKAS